MNQIDNCWLKDMEGCDLECGDHCGYYKFLQVMKDLINNWRESSEHANRNNDEQAAGIFQLCANELECSLKTGSDKVERIGV